MASPDHHHLIADQRQQGSDCVAIGDIIRQILPGFLSKAGLTTAKPATQPVPGHVSHPTTKGKRPRNPRTSP